MPDQDSAVVIVDFQKEWTLKDSPYYLGRTSLVQNKCRTLVHEAVKNKFPIIYTKRYMEGESNIFSEFKERSDLIEKLPKKDKVEKIEHFAWDPFYQTDLGNILYDLGVDQIIVGGVAVNAGVRDMVEGAYDRGWDVTLVKDCTYAEESEDLEQTSKDIQKYRDVFVEVLKDHERFM
ncbi:MAG: cysteine hydrolase [Candidatus Nanohaloarchaeota archaeon QJJ-9]|nr:cysteine hydrolase [Candidatus Nanohaloarchaeota archaeon QJJ-9]